MSVKLNQDYLSKIKGIIQLYTKRKSDNVLEGDFNSAFRARSLEFDDLKEYTYGDNVRDIDWKSSSRAGKVLIRRYVAQRKHNLLVIADAGLKMQGVTTRGEIKSDIALMTFGTIAYLSDKQGADFSIIFPTPHGHHFDYFGAGMRYLESKLAEYEKNIALENSYTIDDTIGRAIARLNKKMIILIITDLDGLSRIDDRLIKHLTYNNDVRLICIDDDFFTGKNTYDLSEKKFVDSFLSGRRGLDEAEKRMRSERLAAGERLFKIHGARLVTISSVEEIIDKTIELFGRI